MKVEEFINILKKLQTIGVDVSKLVAKDTIETLAKKSGINREKLEEIGLDSTLKIGIQKNYISQIYRGLGTYGAPTKKQVEELAKLGIGLEKRDTVQDFIDALEILQIIGVDVSKMTQKDTIETLAEKSGISKEKLEKTGLSPTQKLGMQKARISQAYRGIREGKRPTKEQVEELAKLGISIEKQERDTVQEFINILKKLQTIGVDISKLVAKDTIETLAKKSGINREKLEEIGLDSTLKIGNQKTTIAQAYRGQGTSKPPTKEQVEELAKLGISIEKQERDTVQEFMNILKKLQTIGVDVSKMSSSDTIETLAEKSGISKEKLEKIGLDPMLKIGVKRITIVQAYRGQGNSKPPTKKQEEELVKLGISLQERDTVQEFINILKKLQTIGVDVSKLVAKDTIETLAKKSGINREKLEEIGLDSTLKMGNKKTTIAQAYRGQGTSKPPTKEQVEELVKLGVSLEKQEHTVQEFINILKKLQTIGVDVSKLVARDTIETLAGKSGISSEKLEKTGLDLTQRIGNKKTTIVQAYRGQGTNKPPTKKQVEELAKLGISLERKRITGKKIAKASIISLTKQKMKIEEFINILKTLQTIGVDVSKIVRNDTIETLAKKSGISKEKLEEIGLDPMLKIGLKRTTIVQAYRGKGNSKPPTQEQIEKLAKLGISIEKRKRDTVQEFIDTLEILQTIGVDISKLVAKDTIETLAEKSGISKEKLEEIGLELTLKIGNQRTNIVQAYRGKGNSKPPTQEQIEELAKLGISSEKQRRGTVQEFIDTLEILQTIGVDVSKLTENDTIETLAKKSEISREKVEEIGVDPAQKIGNKKHNIAQAYRGQGTCEPPTEKQVEEIAKLGISLERKRTTGKKIVEASIIISLTAPEMADTEDAALKALVEQREQKLR